MNARPFRIAVVGLGWVARHRHIPSLLRTKGLKLVGVIDRHEGLARRVARDHGLKLYEQTDSIDSVSWIDEVDAVTIAAPPAAHEALALSALARGKHVLTEKPFALSLHEGEAMLEAAKRAGKTLNVVHNFQFGRAAQKLRDDLETGRLGPVRRIAANQFGNPRRRLPTWYESLPLGLFCDESPHFFYLLHTLTSGALHLVGAQAVRGRGNGTKTPALVQLLYVGSEGMPVTVNCDFDSAVSEWHLAVIGEKAMGIVDIFRDIYMRLPNDGAHDALSIARTSLTACSQHLIGYIPNGLAFMRGRLDYGNDEIMRRFESAIRTGKEDILIGARSAMAVLKLQTEAMRALQESMVP